MGSIKTCRAHPSAEYVRLTADVAAINERCIAHHGMTLDDVADGAADPFDILTMNEVRSIVRCFLKRMRTSADRQTESTGSAPVDTRPEHVAAHTPTPASALAPASAAQTQHPAGGTDWTVWTDPVGNGALPDGLDKDDAIAYRMADGSVLFTDYPYDLNWIHEGEPGDIVAYRLLTSQEAADMTPWIAWSGGECPVDGAAMVQVRLFNWGQNASVNAGLQHWQHHAKTHHNYDVNIVAYRVVTP